MPGPLDLFAYLAFRFVETLLHALPLGLALAVSEVLGDAWWVVDRRRRGRARENLRVTGLCGATPRDLKRRVRLAFRAMARVPVEASLADRYLRGRRGRDRCRLEGAWPDLLREAAVGRPALVVTGHLGNWEIGAQVLRSLRPDTRVVARPLEVPLLEAHVVRTRGGRGAVIPKRGALKGTLRALREGAAVAILADQDAGRRGVFVPFLGLPASTSTAPSVLAARSGAPLYLGVCLRRPGPLRFTVHLVRIPGPPPEGDAAASHPVTAALTAELETWVRRAPEQYNWLHRRWKTRPPGERVDALRPAYARVPRANA